MVKIVLDAGHGYNTPGKRSPDGMKEYEFNRAVANYANALLKGYENVHVTFTHSDASDVSLNARTDKANAIHADAFVSIHANAFGAGGFNHVSGVESFIYPRAGADTAEFAKAIHDEVASVSGLSNRGLKKADFHVLRETKMMAVLVECGFMTNKNDLDKLKSDSYRRAVAGAIVEGLAKHFKLKKKPVPKPAPKPVAKPASGKDVDGKVHRVIVDGKQIGAFDNAETIGNLAAQYARSGVKKVEIILT